MSSDTEPIQNAISNGVESTKVEETNIVELKQDEKPKVTETKQEESKVTDSVESTKVEETNIVELKQDEKPKVTETKQVESKVTEPIQKEPKVTETKQEEPKVTEPNQNKAHKVEQEVSKNNQPKQEIPMDVDLKKDKVIKNIQPTAKTVTANESTKEESTPIEPMKHTKPTPDVSKMSTKTTPDKSVTFNKNKSVHSASTPEESKQSKPPPNFDPDCRVLFIKKGIPKDWTFHQIKQFIIENVLSVDLTQKFFFVVMIRDNYLKPTGETLIKFTSKEDAHAVFDVLKKAKRFWVQFDYGSKRLKKAKQGNKFALDAVGEQSTIPDKYELIKKKHDEAFNETKREESERYYEEPPPKRMRQEETYVPYPKAYFPPTPENHDTYGLSLEFLTSLKLQTPLTNKVLLTNLDQRVDEAKLHEVFSLAGQVTNVYFAYKKNGASKCRAHAEFDHPVEAVQAISMFRGKFLYDKPIFISMVRTHTPKLLPEGLMDVGFGLGHDGVPLRGVRTVIELQKIKETLLDMGKIENVASKTEQSPFANPIQLGQVNNLSNAAAANQNPLINALTTLSQQPNLLVGLSALANAQGLLQQGAGDLTGAFAAIQGKNASPSPSIPPSMASHAPHTTENAPQIAPRATQVPHQNKAQYPRPQGHNASQAHNASAQSYNATPQSYNATPQSYNATPQSYNATPQSYNASPQAHNATPQSYNATPQSYNATPQSYNATPQSYNATPQSYNATPQSYNATPQGQSAPPLGHRPQAPAFVQATTQQAYQPTFTQNTIENDWNAQTQAVHSQSVQYGSEPAMYSNKPQTSYNNSQQQYDKYEKDNLNSLDIRRNAMQKEDESDKKSDMLVFSNLPSSVNVQALNAKMREVGELRFGELTGKGGAIVRFKHAHDAERCIKLFNRSKVDGQTIEVRYF